MQFVFKIMKEMRNIMAIYFEKKNIGLSKYEYRSRKIQSSKINYFLKSDVKKLQSLLEGCSTIITNNANSVFFYQLTHDQRQYPNGGTQKQKSITEQSGSINLFQSSKISRKTLQQEDQDDLQEDQIDYDCSKHCKFQVITVRQRDVEDSAIQNNLNTLLKQNPNGLNNYSTIIRGMKIEKQRFKAIGMMIYHLINHQSIINSRQNEESSSKIFFEDIEFNCDSLLHTIVVYPQDLEYLQIYKNEFHPSAIKSNGRFKEGFSLLSLYETFITSTYAKRIFKRYMLNPIYDIKQLRRRQYFLSWIQENFDSYGVDYQRILKIFRKLHPMQNMFKRLHNGLAGEQQIKRAINVSKALMDLKAILTSMIRSQAPDIIKSYLNHPNWRQIKLLHLTLKDVIDFNPFMIKNGIDENLDQLRYLYNNLDSILTLEALQAKNNFPFQIVFLPQIGYLIKISHQTSVTQNQLINFILQFTNSTGNYYISQLTQNLNKKYGDVYGQILEIQQRILCDLQGLIIEQRKQISDLFQLACEIDCFFGLARISLNMSIPKFSSSALILSNSWYPLLGQQAIDNHIFSFNHKQKDTPVRNIVNLEENLVNSTYSNRCVLISGPNGSGKTIYLKQLATIVYLSHTGFLVPAEFAEIPLIDRIIIPRKTQTISIDTVGIENQLMSLSIALGKGILTNRSLVLIDQIATGCTYQQSLKILYATTNQLTINFMRNQAIQKQIIAQAGQANRNQLKQTMLNEIQCPISIIVTHHTQMMASKLLDQNFLIRHLTMQFQDDLNFLFKIKPGIVKSKYGVQIAKRYTKPSFAEKMQKYRKKLQLIY